MAERLEAVFARVCTHATGTNAAERQLGRLEADLAYGDIDEVITRGMHEYLDNLQIQLNQIDAAIGTTYFNIKPATDLVNAEQ